MIGLGWPPDASQSESLEVDRGHLSLKDSDALLLAAVSLPSCLQREEEGWWRPAGMRGGQRAPGYLQSPFLVPEAPELPGSSAVPSILRPNRASFDESFLLTLSWISAPF